MYDVTKFLPDHPGGPEIVLAEAGKDATQAFDEIFHSESAMDQLPKWKIGTLEVSCLARVQTCGHCVSNAFSYYGARVRTRRNSRRRRRGKALQRAAPLSRSVRIVLLARASKLPAVHMR